MDEWLLGNGRLSIQKFIFWWWLAVPCSNCWIRLPVMGAAWWLCAINCPVIRKTCNILENSHTFSEEISLMGVTEFNSHHLKSPQIQPEFDSMDIFICRASVVSFIGHCRRSYIHARMSALGLWHDAARKWNEVQLLADNSALITVMWTNEICSVKMGYCPALKINVLKC